MRGKSAWLLTVVVLLFAGISAFGGFYEWNRQCQKYPVRGGECAASEPSPAIAAPGFDLPLASGSGRFQLRSFQGRKPVALIFGSYTCPFIRKSAAELERLYRQYGDEVQFCFVYTRETHAADEAPVVENEREGIRLSQTATVEDRCLRCVQTLKWLGLSMPAAIDGPNDAVARAYDAIPTIRMHLIDGSGKMVYRSPGTLPIDFRPADLEREILKLVGPDAAAGG